MKSLKIVMTASGRVALVASAGLLLVGLSACASSHCTKCCCSESEKCSSETKHQDSAGKIVGEWSLVAIDGQTVDGSAGVIAAGRPPTLTVDAEGGIFGFGGVNRFRGGVDTQALMQGQFNTGPIASTMMAGPQEAMDLEQRVFAAFERVKRFRVASSEQPAGSTLELIDASGAAVLTFRRVIE